MDRDTAVAVCERIIDGNIVQYRMDNVSGKMIVKGCQRWRVVMKSASATLYRFMSFEEFVDMVQRKQMTLVNPSKYEDVYETEIIDGPLDKRFYSKNNSEDTENLFKFANIIRLKHTYTRSWTSISENDALWRIYSPNKTSVRIGVSINNFESLDGIIVKKVAYVKNIREYFKNREHAFIVTA